MLNIAFIGGLPGANLFVAIVADLILYVAAYVGIFALHGKRWAWYAISCIAFLVLVYQIGFNGHRAVRRRSGQTQTFYSAFVTAKLLAGVLLLMYVLLILFETLGFATDILFLSQCCGVVTAGSQNQCRCGNHSVCHCRCLNPGLDGLLAHCRS